MGYRSDVAYTIRFTSDDDTKNKQSFYTFLAEAKANEDTAPCFMDDEWLTVDLVSMTFNFYVDDVKWYEDYQNVKCHMALIALAEEWAEGDNLSEIGFIYARVGENTDDVEENVGGEYDWDWVRVSRQIVMDWK